LCSRPSLFRIPERADGDGPEPVPMSPDEHAERAGIARDVHPEQLGIGRTVVQAAAF
jgi:hypothetical protein